MKIVIYCNDPKTQKPSVSLTILWITFIVCLTKLLLSGVHIGSWIIPDFSATEFSVALAAVGALYWGRKQSGDRGSSIVDVINKTEIKGE